MENDKFILGTSENIEADNENIILEEKDANFEEEYNNTFNNNKEDLLQYEKKVDNALINKFGYISVFYQQNPIFKKLSYTKENINKYKCKIIEGKIFKITKKIKYNNDKNDNYHVKNKRKYSNDMIRKKIKGHFYNAIIKQIQKQNPTVKENIKSWFYFIKEQKDNTSIKECKINFDLTLEDFMEKYCVNKEKFNKLNINKMIFNKKIKELYLEYLDSQQFEESIMKLKEEGELFDYIHQYINIANNIINYYEESKCRENKNKIVEKNN